MEGLDYRWKDILSLKTVDRLFPNLLIHSLSALLLWASVQCGLQSRLEACTASQLWVTKCWIIISVCGPDNGGVQFSLFPLHISCHTVYRWWHEQFFCGNTTSWGDFKNFLCLEIMDPDLLSKIFVFGVRYVSLPKPDPWPDQLISDVFIFSEGSN